MLSVLEPFFACSNFQEACNELLCFFYSQKIFLYCIGIHSAFMKTQMIDIQNRNQVEWVTFVRDILFFFLLEWFVLNIHPTSIRITNQTMTFSRLLLENCKRKCSNFSISCYGRIINHRMFSTPLAQLNHAMCKNKNLWAFKWARNEWIIEKYGMWCECINGNPMLKAKFKIFNSENPVQTKQNCMLQW